MARAYTKGQKLAQKRQRAMADIPDLEPIRKRHPSGRKVSTADRDPQRLVLSARCSHMGKADTRENRRLMKEAMMGDPAGQAIAIGSRGQKEAAALWAVFSKLDSVDARYHSRILSRGRHAKCGKVEYMPERFEARPDDRADSRTEEQKDRAAVNEWMAWHGAVGHLASHEQSSLWTGVYLRCDLHKNGVLTTAGSAFVSALRILVDVSTRKGLT